MTRLYEPYSERNLGRTLPAAVHHIATHAAVLEIVNREACTKFLVRHGETRQAIEQLSDEQMSRTLAQNLDSRIPRADLTSPSPLDQALYQLKAVRDKSIAHHDRVSAPSLLVPAWLKLVDLIGIANEAVTLVAHAYLSVGYNLADDANRGAQSLRTLLHRVGLSKKS